jgi:hypothetical protein
MEPLLRAERLKKVADQVAKWRKDNKERHEAKRQEWLAINPGYQNTWAKNARKTNPVSLLAGRLRRRLGACLKGSGSKKTTSTMKLLGGSWKHAVEYLENNEHGYKLLDKDMHIDHIRPMKSFKNLHCEFEQRTANHYLNLQLLPAKENQQKHASFDYDSWAASDAGKQLLELNRQWRMERYFQ